MASLKDLRLRIKSVKNTRQITKTMKMVAAAKVNRARTACEKARPYADRLSRVLGNLAASNKDTSITLLTGHGEVHTVRLVVVGSDRGLCGGFNNNLLRQARQLIEEYQGQGLNVQLVTVGRKMRDGLRSTHGSMIEESYVDQATSYSFAEEIANSTTEAFENKQCDKVVILFNHFVNMLKQEPTVQQLIPFTPEEMEDEAGTTSSFEYEPGESEILTQLLPQNIATQTYVSLLESNASEQAARMTAMDNATRNAGDVIKRLNLVYNRGRQAAVTSELIEIISGAEAV